ncbi:O-antigen ligase family protein [Trabulsiella odontotermitis]|uniref:O-antigen ligase family protein n=1 Tax=Trabulsiella odontotermitis TaxID=379893 RepID=UPI0024B67931|nr:O-antigen ligase family protein [Trabulsiella odontotermitis]WHP31445.1 O-antigen ligase family protein [Trabulsiella odontotermitis]
MPIITKLRNYNHAIFLAIIVTVAASIILNFINSPYARIFFYIASYISILSLLINWNKKPEREVILIIAVFALVGFSKYLWFCLEYIGNPDYNKYNPYYNTGKRLLLASIIAWSAFSLHQYLTDIHKKIITQTIFAAFIISSAIGLYQNAYFPVQRVDFFLGFATDSAYMYSAIALSTILLLEQHKNIIARIGIVFCFVIAFYILFKTGTRNVLIFFPFVLLICLVAWRKNVLKKAAITLAAIIVAIAVGYKPFIESRIHATEREIATYAQHDGNRSGSLTARFAMWKVGYHAFIAHPWGMSFEKRAQFAQEFTQRTNSNKSALQFMNIHLHNEFIDTATLQGIPGILVLIFAYLSLLYYAFREKDPLFLGVTLIIITVGFTDVIFISREQSIFFPLLFIQIAMLRQKKPESIA